METVLAIAGIIVGGVISWVISHYYYKRQTRELVDPTPQIRGVHQAVLELYNLSLERRDEELEKAISKLLIAMLHARMRVLNSVTAGRLLLALIDDLRTNGDKDEVISKLNEYGDNITSISNGLSEIGNEFSGLHEIGEQIYGKKFEFTHEEFIEFLRSPQNSRHTMK